MNASASTNSGTPAVANMTLPQWRQHLAGYRRRLGTSEDYPQLLPFFRRDCCARCRVPVDDCHCD